MGNEVVILDFALCGNHKAVGTPNDTIQTPIKDDLKPMDQLKMLWIFVLSKKLIVAMLRIDS